MNKQLTGRQMLFMVRESFKTEAHMDVCYATQDLLALKWLGDKSMCDFLQKWDQLTESLEPGLVGDKLLRDVCLDQVSKSDVLNEDLAHYRRKKP